VVNAPPTPPSASNPQATKLEPAAPLNSNGGVRSTGPTRRLELNRTTQGAGPHAGNVRRVQGEVVIDSPVDAADPHQGNGANSSVEPSANSSREVSRAANPVSTVLTQEAESGWAPDPEVVAAAPLRELTKLVEELFQLATRGGVLVRIASGPECEHIKSEVAAQLAWMLAERGSARVLLLEADFERPAVRRVMKVETPPFKGFSQQLHQRATSGARAAWSVLRCAPSLNVLAEGRVRTLGLLDSPEFSVALAELRRYYDVIIADGPVIDSGVDSRALDGVADSIVYVTTSGAAVSATIELISQTYGDRELVWVVRTAAAPES
jgi:Mrp family chromosome partitioning ATPase